MRSDPFHAVRSPGRLALAIITSLTISSIVLFGCGEETPTATSASSTNAGTVSTTPLPAPEPQEGEPVAEEQTAPYGAGSTSNQAVGTLIDGLQLSDVRWADHDTYFRIVFDMATPEGEPVLQVPHAEASLSPDAKTLTVQLGGVRSISQNPQVVANDLAVGNELVTSIKRIPSMDDQLLIYEIQLTRPSNYSLAGLGSPGRIVIDINKS